MNPAATDNAPVAARRRPRCLLVAADELRTAFDRERGRRAVVQTSWDLPVSPWDLAGADMLCVAAVTSAADGDALVRAVARGVDVIVAVDDAVPAAVRRDLHRLADVTVTLPVVERVDLSADQRQILELLGEGASLPEVADSLYLSLRTAERRLSGAKRLLGVRSTAEALVAVAAGR